MSESKNKPIRIVSPSFELLGEIDDYQSLIFTRRWHKYGEFELVINRHKQHTNQLLKNNLVMLDKDPHKVGIIKHREIQLSKDGKETENWLIKGYTLEGIAIQRETVPPIGLAYDVANGPAETAMKRYVVNNIVSPVDVYRKIGQVVTAQDQQRGINVRWNSRYKMLASELESISIISGLGWFIYLDIEQQRWVFEVKEGRYLTADQDILPPVIFSTDFDSIETQSFVDSSMNYKNVAYVGGQGVGELREIVSVGSAFGLERYEMFVDARHEPNPANLITIGNQNLNENDVIRSFEATILTHSPFVYGSDWDLGDIVTVQSTEWGVTLNTRIIEVKEVYQSNGFKLDVTFGNKMPSFGDQVKKLFKKVDNQVL